MDMEKLYVIKIGGNIVDEPTVLTTCLKAFAALDGHAVLVHGGGKLATQLADQLGVKQQMIEGRRITDAATLKIVTMVYGGFINKSIVAQLQAEGVNVIGVTGVDFNLIKAHKRLHSTIDFGFVGDIDEVNANAFIDLLQKGTRLVIAPLTHDGKGQILNTNADTIAQSIATTLSHHYDVHLIYGFEKEGVLLDVQDPASVIGKMNFEKYQQLKSQNIIVDGMLPKMDNAFKALEQGVHTVVIGKGEKLKELIQGTAGTTIQL
jgi:acetylglutamate kinase